jgi:hypothetical protein
MTVLKEQKNEKEMGYHCVDTHMSFHLLFNPVSPHSSPSSVHTTINTPT